MKFSLISIALALVGMVQVNGIRLNKQDHEGNMAIFF